MTGRSRYKGDHSSGLPTDRIISEIDSQSALNIEDVSQNADQISFQNKANIVASSSTARNMMVIAANDDDDDTENEYENDFENEHVVLTT